VRWSWWRVAALAFGVVYLLAAAAAGAASSHAWRASVHPAGVLAHLPVDPLRAGGLAAVGALAVLSGRWPRAARALLMGTGILGLTLFAGLGMYGLVRPH